MGSSTAATTKSRPQHQRRWSSRKHPSAPLGCRSHIIADIVPSLACLSCCLTAVAAATTVTSTVAGEHRHPRRGLEGDDGFSGKWDGQWQADSNEYYRDCIGDECPDDDSAREGWFDSVDSNSLTPEQIVTYVTLGILGFMTLLCLVCYPEIVSVPCMALRDTCCSLLSGSSGIDGGSDGDYVGGRELETPRSKKKKKKGDELTKGGLESSKDVELV
ncbi:hypothetical protein ACHAW5_010462 [Stephanodiscus triporus]|uniref:Uncharacterized protein n=1 Tax=Stephanodiscus triporus TaxID=2934178 RepID=A0ABD3P974_9STRA